MLKKGKRRKKSPKYLLLPFPSLKHLPSVDGVVLHFTDCEAETQEASTKMQMGSSAKNWTPLSRHLTFLRLRCLFMLADLMPRRRQGTALNKNSVPLNCFLNYVKKSLPSPSHGQLKHKPLEKIEGDIYTSSKKDNKSLKARSEVPRSSQQRTRLKCCVRGGITDLPRFPGLTGSIPTCQ